MYLSRQDVPFNNKNRKKFFKTFVDNLLKPKALIKYAKIKRTSLEESENIELIRALEIGLKIKTENLTGDSFSVDVKKDFYKAKRYMLKDQLVKKYSKL